MPEPHSLSAPGEASGRIALESAIALALPAMSFGPFHVLLIQRLLLDGDLLLRLGSRALDLLTALVERAGELAQLGLVLEPFGPGAVLVRETPALLGDCDVVAYDLLYEGTLFLGRHDCGFHHAIARVALAIRIGRLDAPLSPLDPAA